MGMIGEYARLTPAQLERAAQDPGWARTYVDGLVEAVAGSDEPSDPATARSLDVDKAWYGLAFLAERAGLSFEVLLGEQELPGADDWGYGPPRHLTPAQVAVTAEKFGALGWQQLTEGVTPQDFFQAEVYPSIWDDEKSMDYLRAHHEDLVTFFRAAARDGDAILAWIS
jgi:uncharacterized protein DUF1877